MSRTATNPILTLSEAAEYIGMTDDDLMMSRYRGLPPGTLGFKDAGRLVWRRVDLLPAPDRLTCRCGFNAKTKAGLATHQRRHG